MYFFVFVVICIYFGIYFYSNIYVKIYFKLKDFYRILRKDNIFFELKEYRFEVFMV